MTGGRSAQPRADLAAMIMPIGRQLIAHEQEILADHGMTMWGYIILSALAECATSSQTALASAIRHDKSRLIADLDELQEQGYITRTPDPQDRRARLVAITATGRQRQGAVQRAIHAREDELLAGMPERDRRTLRRLLRTAGELISARTGPSGERT